MIERNGYEPAVDSGANLRGVVSDDQAFEFGYVSIEADETVSEAAIVRDRAQQIVETFQSNMDKLAANYNTEIQRLIAERDRLLAKDSLYLTRAQDIVGNAEAYANLKMDYDQEKKNLIAEIEEVEGQIGVLEAHRADLTAQHAAEDEEVSRLKNEATNADNEIINLSQQASRLEENFVGEATQEELEAYHGYGASQTYHHGVHNLTPDQQERYRALNAYFEQCQTEVREANLRIREIIRQDLAAESEITRLQEKLAGLQEKAVAMRGDDQVLSGEFNRIMAMMDGLTERYDIRFEEVEEHAEDAQEQQPEINLRAPIDIEEETHWQPDDGVRVIGGDESQKKSARKLRIFRR